MEGGYQFLLDLALILLSTKLLGLLTKRFQLPQVVGALLAGLILGPAVLNVIHETEFIKETAEDVYKRQVLHQRRGPDGDFPAGGVYVRGQRCPCRCGPGAAHGL